MRPSKNTRYKVKDTDNEITKLRKNASLTQERLASAIGMAVSTIRRWEQGKCEPTMQVRQMKAFCEAVQVKFEELPQSLTEFGQKTTSEQPQTQVDQWIYTKGPKITKVQVYQKNK